MLFSRWDGVQALTRTQQASHRMVAAVELSARKSEAVCKVRLEALTLIPARWFSGTHAPTIGLFKTI